jgi:hypothetical protein
MERGVRSQLDGCNGVAMKFIYNSGQRPLDGYTIKRGIGRGGFGEVYYAVSDGGKEVALKLVRGGNMEVELRGMAQCLNLKHPNLVGLYDLRTDVLGDHWVIMEYVAGEPLSVVLTRHPQGLPRDLAEQWFLGLARAVSCLHDHGIVHRDLKPANIFIENGMVKVGDYGLCKFISGSQRTAQTQSVGTVHYMAPEISTGNYNKQIDVYASGVILYEMLTGRVPFDGESAGEILMKHLTTPPDLTRLPAEYVLIVGRALAKNPAHRYSNMVEMAKELESLRAPRAEPRPKPEVRGPKFEAARVEVRRSPQLIPAVLPVQSVRTQATELCVSLVLAALLAGAGTMLWAALSHGSFSTNQVIQIFFLTVAASWAVLIPAKCWANYRGDTWARRIVMMILGLLVGMGALWVDGWSPPSEIVMARADGGVAEAPRGPWHHPMVNNVAGHLSYFALAFFALRWWKLTDRRRPHRFSFAPVLAAACWGVLLLLVWSEPWRGTLVITATAAIVQLVSPWDQPVPPVVRRMRLRYA